MPVARYFMFVGGALLALLFLIDAYAPSQAVVASHAAPSIDRNVVRIRSDQKLPERVVYDTSLPTIVPPASKVQVAAAPRPPVASDVTAQARVRDTFAQFVPGRRVKKPEPAGPAQAQGCPEPRQSADAAGATTALRLFRRNSNTW